MEIVSLEEITKGENWIGLGIAGNQADHLNQAGESADFKNIIAPDNAPKGMFPWYLPGSKTFLGVNPLSHENIHIRGKEALQPEPEIALIVKLTYSDLPSQVIKNISVLGFSAFNDCSSRTSANKISMKKNWGPFSQGMAADIVRIEDFSKTGSYIDQFRLTCYLERDGELLQYGKDTAVSDYCYFNVTLVEWMVNQLNTQEDHGPLEDLKEFLADTKPIYGIIGIGATCYSDFGNSNNRFLRKGDKVYVTTYHSEKYSQNDIEQRIKEGGDTCSSGDFILLSQEVVE